MLAIPVSGLSDSYNNWYGGRELASKPSAPLVRTAGEPKCDCAACLVEVVTPSKDGSPSTRAFQAAIGLVAAALIPGVTAF
jgi:hypothetical protein